MGTHVRVNALDGRTLVCERTSLGLERDDVGGCFVFTDDPSAISITPAEYDRLAAMLTGEKAPECGRCGDAGRVWSERAWKNVPCRYCSEDFHGISETILDAYAETPDPRTPGQVPSARELAEAHGFAPLSPEEFRMNVDRECRAAETDPRTPGRVAWEAYGLLDGWNDMLPEGRARWERVAAAVLAHGRGE